MTYGIVENGCCVNAIEAEAWYAESIGAIPLPAGYWIGDYYNGGWHHEKPPTIDDRLATLETEVSDISTAIERGLNL